MTPRVSIPAREARAEAVPSRHRSVAQQPLMSEVVSQAMAREYEHFLTSAQFSVMNDPKSLRLMRTPHVQAPR
jgi:hypothetical protein